MKFVSMCLSREFNLGLFPSVLTFREVSGLRNPWQKLTALWQIIPAVQPILANFTFREDQRTRSSIHLLEISHDRSFELAYNFPTYVVLEMEKLGGTMPGFYWEL